MNDTLFNDLDTGDERVLLTPDIINLLALNHPETGERFRVDGNTKYCRILMKVDKDKLKYKVLDKATGITYLCSDEGGHISH